MKQIIKMTSTIGSVGVLLTLLILFNCNSVKGSSVKGNSVKSSVGSWSNTSTSEGVDMSQFSTNKMSISVAGTTRTINSNSIPVHPTGTFPNRNNPNAMTPQNISVTMSSAPRKADTVIAGSATELGSGYTSSGL